MVPLAVFGIFALLMSAGVECGYSSSSSSSSSNSDGTGHTFTSTNNNGQGTYHHTQTRPGGVNYQSTGPYYGPSNYGQQPFGFNYGPSYGYNPFGSNPLFTPFPQQPFGFNAAFQPLPPLQFNPFPLGTPQEFSNYLNGIQQQYAAFFKAQQQNLLNSWQSAPYAAGYSSPNYAYASGSYGPGGYAQTAGVYPENKYKPNVNVNTRFDGSEGGTAASSGPGFFGVQTSSFSSSSNVNGVEQHKDVASTTVNDNGKVHTYTVEN